MNFQLKEEIKNRNVSKLIKQCDDIVISGIGCRLPLTDNCDEFAKNLYDHVDMVTEDDNSERWPKSKGNSFVTNKNFLVRDCQKWPIQSKLILNDTSSCGSFIC